MKSKVLDNIIKHKLIKSEDTVIVGVSGGYDSMVLLDLLVELKDALKIEIIVAHVNHMLRGPEADGDEAHVRDYAIEHGLDFVLERRSMEELAEREGISSEDAGRRIRYEFFYGLADRYENAVIAVAHNKNDQVETILLNLLRGTGLKGLTGMKYKSDSIIRPLLNISRAEIEEYAEQKGIVHREDSTNQENIYRRNSIRNELIPFITREYNPDFNNTIFRMTEILADQEEIIENITEKSLNQILIVNNDNSYTIIKSDFNKMEAAIRKNIMRLIINKILGTLDGFESSHIEQFINTALRPTGKTMKIGGIQLSVQYENLVIERIEYEENLTNYHEIMINKGKSGVYKFGEYLIEVDYYKNDKKTFKSKKDTVCFDADKIEYPLIIRTRKPGDYFTPYGMKGTKKLKNLMIDQKIKTELRNKIPIITTNNGDIIWVGTIRRSDKYKVDEMTENIIRLKIRGELA